MSKRVVTMDCWGDRLSILERDIPQIVRAFCIDFDVDLPKLWRLPGEAKPVSMSQLSWLLDVAFWPDAGKLFRVSPRAVLAQPTRYQFHAGKIATAALHYPVDVFQYAGRYVIVDGLHRLARHRMLGHSTVPCKIHSIRALSSIKAVE